VAANNAMKGQVASMADVTRKTIAEEKMTGGARLSIQQSTVAGDAGDCDADGLVEPLPYADGSAGAHPVGGGWLPADIGATAKDPWGTPYGYCVWDPGDLTLSDAAAGCGGGTAKRLQGRGADHNLTPAALSDTVVAIISAGKDRKFSTICNAFADTAPADGAPDLPLVQRASGGDDIIIEYSYNDANGLGGEDLWKVRDTKPDTATISKDIEIGGSATLQGALELKERGLLLPDDTETGPCTGLNESELRVNGGVSPPVLEICYNNGWEPISMGEGGGGDEDVGVCSFDTWESYGAGLTWQGVAISDNGQKLFAVTWAGGPPGSNGIYRSIDGGATWTQTLVMNETFNGISASPDGTRVVAFVYYNDLFQLSTDSGATWTGIPNTDGIAVLKYAMSADGMKVVMGINSGGPWYSTNGGASFDIADDPWEGSGGVDLSPDGTKAIFADRDSGYIWTSTDGGANWVQRTTSGVRNWYGVAISEDGQKMAAVASTGKVYISDDGGATWNERLSVAAGDWSSIAMSDNGKHIAVAPITAGKINTSDDGGLTWKTWGSAKNWVDIDMTASGNKIIATDGAGGSIWYSEGTCGEALPAEPESALPDPLVRYNLDETTGTTVADAMGNINATLTGAAAPPSVTGIIGRAYDLDGTDDVIGVTSATLQGLTQYTFSTWLYSPSAGANHYIYDSRNTGSSGVRLWRTSARALSMTLGTGGAYTTTETVPDNAWTHIAFSYDTAALTEPPAIYINGVAATQASFTAPSANTAPSGILQFGLQIGGALPNPGILDDIRIYPQILNADQIAILYNDRDSTAYVAPNSAAILGANKYRGKISTGGDMSCGIKDDGTAWCWGLESNGSMGNGSATADCTSPCRVETQTLSNGFVQISSGTAFSCGIKTDGSAWCWGLDGNGQLGDGATTGPQINPSAVSSAGTNIWTQISVGALHACGLQNDGRIYCWGSNTNGRLGTGGGATTSPVVVSDAGPWVSVSAGEASTCAIKTDGSAWCWGSQQYGRLGNDAVAAGSVTAPSPVLEPGPWIKISRQYRHTCGIKLDGTAWCWGNNPSGQLGNAKSGTDMGKPQRVLDYGPWLDIEPGTWSAHTCGIKLDGTMWCWGSDASGQLGNGASVTTDQNTPNRVLDPGLWAAVSGGASVSCGIKIDGSAWCWGGDTNGRLGNGAVLAVTQHVPSRVANFAQPSPFSSNDAQTLLTKNSAATTISLDTAGGRIGFDGASGGFGFTGSGRSILANPAGNSGLSIESTGAYDSQISWKTVTAGATRSIGVDNANGNLEFGVNNAGVTNWMSAITPQMSMTQAGYVGVGIETPGVRLDVGTGGVRVGADARTCTLSRKGVLRLSGGALQYCNGSAWTAF
jgi:alpha-tubulin suppressor-like RCC1 family protein